jgi:hypothetical protein
VLKRRNYPANGRASRKGKVTLLPQLASLRQAHF